MPTVNVAEAVPPVPPFVELAAPVVLFFVPVVVPVTFTEIVQELFAATVPPLRLIVVAPPVGAKVPPQVLLAFGVLATCTPPGNVSLTATPVRVALLAPGLVMVRVKVEIPFARMTLGAKALVRVGGTSTAKVAEAVPPVPPLVEVTAPVVLFLAPELVAVTLIEAAQEPLAATVPPVRLIVVAPAAPVKVAPQLLVRFGVLATCMPAGNVSLTAIPVSVTVFPAGLVIVSVSVDVPFTGMLVGLKALVMVGATSTAKLADAVFPVPPFAELTAPVVLLATPELVAVTLTDTVQELLTANVPPLRLIVVAPPVGAKVPPQVLMAFGVPATWRAAGKVSLTAIPVSATVLAAGLVIVRVRVEIPFTGMLVGEKALAIVGGATTVWVKFGEVLPV